MSRAKKRKQVLLVSLFLRNEEGSVSFSIHIFIGSTGPLLSYEPGFSHSRKLGDMAGFHGWAQTLCTCATVYNGSCDCSFFISDSVGHLSSLRSQHYFFQRPIYFISFVWMSVLPACVYGSDACLVPMETRRKYQIPWHWSYRWLRTTT